MQKHTLPGVKRTDCCAAHGAEDGAVFIDIQRIQEPLVSILPFRFSPMLDTGTQDGGFLVTGYHSEHNLKEYFQFKKSRIGLATAKSNLSFDSNDKLNENIYSSSIGDCDQALNVSVAFCLHSAMPSLQAQLIT